MVTASFYNYKKQFRSLKNTSLVFQAIAALWTIITLFLCSTWMHNTYGVDNIYVWFLTFVYIVELVVFGPLTMFLLNSNDSE